MGPIAELGNCLISGSFMDLSSCVPWPYRRALFLPSALRGCLAGRAGMVRGPRTASWLVGGPRSLRVPLCRFLLARLMAFQFTRNCLSIHLTSRPSSIPGQGGHGNEARSLVSQSNRLAPNLKLKATWELSRWQMNTPIFLEGSVHPAWLV